jgi:DNA end-binding protein Ku
MQQLLYAAEVRAIGEIEIPQADVKDAELKLAVQLVEQQASDAFDPGAYTDEVKARVEALIEQKVQGHEIAISEEAPAPGGQVIDLMEALRASLKKRAPEAEAPARTAERKPPKRAASAVAKKKKAGAK